MQSFLFSLLDARAVLEEYSSDIIGVDYKLYEEIDDCIHNRISILSQLSQDNESALSVDKLLTLTQAYSELVASLEKVKEDLQTAIRSHQ